VVSLSFSLLSRPCYWRSSFSTARPSKAETLEGPFKGAKAVFFAAAGKTRQAIQETDEAGVGKVGQGV